jgi:hypothetical protein
MRLFGLMLVFAAIGCLPADAARRAIGSDIPGDGVVPCGPNTSFNPICPGGVGSVSLLPGTPVGQLQQGASTLNITVSDLPVYLRFTATPANPGNPSDYNPGWTGPLGLNPQFQPTAQHVGDVNVPPALPPSLAYFDATIPISGQELRLNVLNGGTTTLNNISLFLGRDLNSLSTPASVQNDGLTFGMYCIGQTHAQSTPNDCGLAANWKLLITPSGPGLLDPLDASSTSDTFGDVLRFGNAGLAPGQTGEFTFFVTDYLSTRTPPGGSLVPANQSFLLGVVPSDAAVPEPGSAGYLGFTLGAFTLAFGYADRRKRRQSKSVV